MKAGAEHFVAEQMADGDAAGVFVNNGMYHGRLSTDRTELLAGVRSVTPAQDNRQSLLAPFREFRASPARPTRCQLPTAIATW